MDFSYITQKGYNKLQKQLDYHMKVKRKEIAEQMAHARGFGDLSENAEYDAAKEALAFNEAKIKELSERIASVQVVDERKIKKDSVFLGAVIKVFDYEDNEEVEFEIVSAVDGDILNNKLSVASPFGKALLGKKAGAVIKMDSKHGKIKYKLLSISRD